MRPFSLTPRLHVVIVDDSEADVHWMQITLRDLRLDCVITVLTDGEQAVNFLLAPQSGVSGRRPDIVFLDINLPKLTGIEVLNAVHPSVKHPICIVSGSLLEREIMRERFDIGGECYIVKPVDGQRILLAFDTFEHLKPVVSQLRYAS